jgi:exodeoxyribonuclease-3
VITLDTELLLVTVYTPNSKTSSRAGLPPDLEDAFLDYLKALDAKKAVIVCGDLTSRTKRSTENPKTTA